jgi:hypothetical protein
MRKSSRRWKWVAAAAFAVTVAAPARAADTPSRPDSGAASDTDTKLAMALVVRGVKRYKAHDYLGAREAFVEAYKFDPLPGTLLNLALSELKADQPVEAAHDFREYLKSAGEPREKLDAVRTTYLPLAESQTARLRIHAPRSIPIRVDGAAVDPSAWSADDQGRGGQVASVDVRVGDHDVTGRDGPSEPSQHVTLKAGEVIDVRWVAPAAPAGEMEGTSRLAPSAEPADESAPRRRKWITVVALGSGAALAAGVGVALAVIAKNQASDAGSARAMLDPTGVGSACYGAAASSGPCVALSGETEAARRNWTLSVVSYAGAGALGAAALAAAMLWRPGPPAAVGIQMAPLVTARSAGLSLHGDW